MTVDVPRRGPIHALAALPALPWIGIHLLLYLGVAVVVPLLWEPAPAGSRVEAFGQALTEVPSVIFSPGGVMVSALAAGCLGVLRLLSRVRWYWFRLAAILLFGVPLPLFVFAAAGAEAAVPVAVPHLLVALLVVQPRRPDGWAEPDPAPEGHRW
ncbi:hypothetical protein ACQP26_13715 [Micromonospora sp. CA-248089]|uniref:hypothetical protein n=1 Tax=Micromonospora sp. CA-248089 TaxID=3239960 RepID=UPI003D90FF24